MSVKRNLLLTLMALFIGGAILYYQYRPLPAPVDATWADAQQEAERGGYRLITTQELAARYQQEPHSLLAGGHPPGLGVYVRLYPGRPEFSH